ncbi:hypothetical protein WMY93_026568 [Mugilogobius chulae]|uniref:L1 transposable element RRM domain-containing protein n=1 Tax=Mugilogobius chulae TaxID=88201 RepID=A0AAW0NAI5_9GOBI
MSTRAKQAAKQYQGATKAEWRASEAEMDTLMAAIKASEERVLAKIETSNSKIDVLSKELRSEMANLRADHTRALEAVELVNDSHETRIKNLEEEANAKDDEMKNLENKIQQFTQQIKQLETRSEDLESTQRRNNCRLVGVNANFGTERPVQALAKIIKEALELDHTPALDWAYRSGPQSTFQNFVIKFHDFQDKVDVLRKAAARRLGTQGKPQLRIYPDYTPTVRAKRAAFNEVRALLRDCPDVRYGISYPATLGITTREGGGEALNQ